jgi:hypothetical protein
MNDNEANRGELMNETFENLIDVFTNAELSDVETLYVMAKLARLFTSVIELNSDGKAQPYELFKKMYDKCTDDANDLVMSIN